DCDEIFKRVRASVDCCGSKQITRQVRLDRKNKSTFCVSFQAGTYRVRTSFGFGFLLGKPIPGREIKDRSETRDPIVSVAKTRELRLLVAAGNRDGTVSCTKVQSNNSIHLVVLDCLLIRVVEKIESPKRKDTKSNRAATKASMKYRDAVASGPRLQRTQKDLT